jgi:hypothetical protein
MSLHSYAKFSHRNKDMPHFITFSHPDSYKPLFQAFAAMFMRSVLFWDITRRCVVIVYRRFGTRVGSIFTGQKSEYEIKPATYNVGLGKYGGVAIRRRYDSH